MPFYKNPDFLQPPPGLGKIFAREPRPSFFSLPQWYDLMARFGADAGSEIRVYTDERPDSGCALPLQRPAGGQPLSLVSLANSYSVEHGPIRSHDAPLDGALSAVVGEILADRPRWDCLRLLELDLS